MQGTRQPTQHTWTAAAWGSAAYRTQETVIEIYRFAAVTLVLTAATAAEANHFPPVKSGQSRPW
jgi:hypothetical protein